MIAILWSIGIVVFLCMILHSSLTFTLGEGQSQEDFSFFQVMQEKAVGSGRHKPKECDSDGAANESDDVVGRIFGGCHLFSFFFLLCNKEYMKMKFRSKRK